MRILIADDDADIRLYARCALEAAGYEVLAAASGEEALAQLQRFDPALLLTDVRMEGLDGLDLMIEARRLRPELPVVMMTSYASIDSAVEAMRLGAADYLTKPLNADGLALRVAAVLRLRSLESENRWLRRELVGAFRPECIVAVSPGMRRVVEVIEKLAQSEASVLLTGESGTGKDLLARALHFRGPRAGGPFVALNCAALPAGLVESELFGHAKGAFTGAVAERPGKLEQAHTGTLFLDEVGELPLETQPKLLRALETRLFERVGDNRTRSVDVRLVSATNRDLRALVRQGRFREDLYFRLAVVPVAVPPLRERPEDIGPLARYFVARVAGEDAPELSDDALAALERRSWPGNARELANLIECTLALHEGGPIRAADLRSEVSAPGAAPEPAAAGDGAAAARTLLPPEGASLDAIVRDVLVAALDQTGWNQSAAARLLRIPRHVLQYRMMKYRIVPPAARSRP
jgi:two-component system NtrC family response regulator